MDLWSNLFNLGINFLVFIFISAILVIFGSIVWFKILTH